MRSKYYVITAFSLDDGRRVVAYETDWAVLAFCKWWELKMDNDHTHLTMTIRES